MKSITNTTGLVLLSWIIFLASFDVIFGINDPSLVSNFELKLCTLGNKPCVEARWGSQSTEKIKYRLQYRIVWPYSLAVGDYSTHDVTDTTFTMDTHSKPAYGVTYEFKIAKFNKGTYGSPTRLNISLPESVPSDSPKNLMSTNIDANTIKVSWQAPDPQYHNGKITNYQVRYYANKHEENTEKMINVTDTNIILSDLFYPDYKIFVRAYTSAGAGIWSNPKYYYRLISQDLPIPSNVRAYRHSSTELEIKWSLPEAAEKDKESSRIVGFFILYSPISVYPKWTVHYTQSTELNANIKGLKPSINYQVKVAVINSQGLNGSFSITVEETKNTLPRPNSQTVRNLHCSVLQSNMLKLEWLSPVITADITKFQIIYDAQLSYTSTINFKKTEYVNRTIRFVEFEANIKSYSIQLDHLQSNAVYTIGVHPIYARNRNGHSLKSSLQTICTTRSSLPDFVDAPVPLDVSQDGKLIKLKLIRISERNGPLSNYTIIIGAFRSRKNDRLPILKDPVDYSFMELASHSRQLEYSGPYIAISSNVNQLFSEKGKNWTEIILGNSLSGFDVNTQEVNRRLDSHLYYKAFLRVCPEEHVNLRCKSSNWSTTFNLKENTAPAPESKTRGIKGYSGDLSYTVILVALLLSGVVLAVVCIIVGCVIKRRKWKKRIINVSNNNHQDSLRSSILLKTSMPNGGRSPEKYLLSPDMEVLRNHSKKYSTAPDLVTTDSVLMCQDGSKLSPILVNGSKRNLTNSLRQENNIKSIPDKPPTAITNLYQYISDLKANESALLQSEFETLNTNLDDRFSWQRSNIDCNKSKNRYANVVAYDHTSVLLKPFDDVIGSDYINANYIDGYQKQNAYIASQGPLPDTTDDFWRMVWEQNSTSVVMMTRLEERSGVKCHQYWPNRGFICYGQMIVCHIESFSFSYYTIRVFELRHSKHTEKREIHHFQFTAWPDHGVPKLSTPLLMFIRRYRSMIKIDSGPSVVHCSAGVGRTGAFIVIEAQLERIKHEKSINVFNYVSKIRCQRNYMVQTQAQYLFILETLLEAIEDGNTEVIALNLHSHVSKLSQIGLTGANELSGFELEFSKLNSLASNRDRHGIMLADFVKAAGNQPVNLTKNKIRNIIPYDWNRVILPAIRGIDGSDYINASYIDGYRDRRAYIAAQSPLPASVEDFWRMIWDQHCGVVVVLNQSTEDKCHIYWPVHKSIRYQFFVVDPVVEYNMPNYILREFKVTDARDGEFRTLRQFQFTQWPSHGCPKESDSILDFIRQVHKTKEQFGHMEPMVIHCSTGSGRTGVFVALSIVIDRLQQESVVDMYQIVKLLHKQRLGLVQTEEQYEFCYKAVVDYLSFYEKNEKTSGY